MNRIGSGKCLILPYASLAWSEIHENELTDKSREFYQKLNETAQENVNAVEDFMLASHAGAKSVSEKIMQNAAATTESAFDAAQSMARAKTLPEAARLQADFMQPTDRRCGTANQRAVRVVFKGRQADIRVDQQGHSCFV